MRHYVGFSQIGSHISVIHLRLSFNLRKLRKNGSILLLVKLVMPVSPHYVSVLMGCLAMKPVSFCNVLLNFWPLSGMSLTLWSCSGQELGYHLPSFGLLCCVFRVPELNGGHWVWWMEHDCFVFVYFLFLFVYLLYFVALFCVWFVV